SAIAVRHGVRVDDLASLNGIGDVNRIREGQVLRLPGSSGGTAVASSAGGRYLVRRGDTLSRIAADQHVDAGVLARLNGLRDPHRIFAGTWLRLPGAAAGGSAPAPSGATSYVVRAGDNLTTIGRRFGISPRTIAEANGLANPQFIRIGARLSIPVASGGSSSSS